MFERCEYDSGLGGVSLSMISAASARARAKWLLMGGCERFLRMCGQRSEAVSFALVKSSSRLPCLYVSA